MGNDSAAAAVADSKVSKIIKSLNALEDDLDSLNGKVGDIKKQIAIRTQGEIESLMEKTREMAAKEAETLINKSKKKAEIESKKITEEGEARLSEIKSRVDANFDLVVEDVVSMILKP